MNKTLQLPLSPMSSPLDIDEQFNGLQQAAYQLSSCTDQIFLQIKQQQALASVVDRIRSSLDIETIFKTTATDIRELLNADRVGVFRFIPDSGWDDGEFVAEDVVGNFPSAMETKVHDHCFGSQFAAYYTQGRVQAVADIHEAGLSDCHVQVLAQFQIRANLIVPVLKGDELWGLLCVHQCAHPRRWQLTEIEFVKKIASHFAIALQQAQSLEELQDKIAQLDQAKAQQKALFTITNRIRQSLGWESVCETATEEVRKLLKADRVAVYRFNSDWSGDFIVESVADGWKPLVGSATTADDTHLMETKGGRYIKNETLATADIYEAGYADCHVALLEQFQARAHVIVPIFQGEHLWGLLAAFQNAGPRQWTDDEINLLSQISEQLGVALQQAEFVWKIQSQSVELKQALEELKQSQMQMVQNEKMASLGQLVAGVAHEINNPVNFIHGNLKHIGEYMSDLMALVKCYQQPQDPASDEQSCDYQAQEIDVDFLLEDVPKVLSSMKIGTERIRQIVLSLRNFSRLDEADLKAVNIHEGIDSTLLILSHRFKAFSRESSVEVIKQYGDIPLVECYPAKLNQVFMNLLANAIDAIEEDIKASTKPSESLTSEPLADPNQAATKLASSKAYKIWVSTQLNDQSQIEIKIRDNGIGLKQEDTGKVFDHFFTTKPVGKGTGLGLSISRKIIIESHGGTLTCQVGPNNTTEFVICLPLKNQK